jgi:hypothetical protein
VAKMDVIHGMVDGLVSAHVVHSEGVTRPRRKVWSGLVKSDPSIDVQGLWTKVDLERA